MPWQPLPLYFYKEPKEKEMGITDTGRTIMGTLGECAQFRGGLSVKIYDSSAKAENPDAQFMLTEDEVTAQVGQ